MINPDRIHLIKKAVVVEFNAFHCGDIKLKYDGLIVAGWIDEKTKISVGDSVNAKVKFSIMADSYIVKKITKNHTRG